MTRRIAYAKLHACGNDFLVVEHHLAGDEAALTRALCARTTGVGADGVEYLQLESPVRGAIQLRNADGSVAEISGNGTRCVAAWMAHRADASAGEAFVLHTDAGERVCELAGRSGHEFQFRQAMGVPAVAPERIALAEGFSVEGLVVNTGNPHFVVRVDDGTFTVGGQPWEQVGRAICFHPRFPLQMNVEFVHVRAADGVEIRIFERGVGPTTSSGTGTCASAAAVIAAHGALRRLTVTAPGGAQQVEWDAPDAAMYLTGPAVLIAAGEAWV